MKVKFSIIPFIPFLIVTVALKLMSVFGLDNNGQFMGMDIVTISYTAIVLTLALFLVCVVINIFDRKTAPVYALKKNLFAGILAALSGISVVSISFFKLVHTLPSDEHYFIYLLGGIVSVVTAVVLVLISRLHFKGKSVVYGISALFVFPALWSCIQLIEQFLVSTKSSISTSDMTEMFCYIFLTLYFFAQSMILSRVKGRNPVKACYIYGLPATSILITYGVYLAANYFKENSGLTVVLSGIAYILIALYIFVFIIELNKNSLTKNEVEIIEDFQTEEDSYEESYIKSGGYDEVVYSKRDSKEESTNPDLGNADNIPVVQGLDDFVMGYKEEEYIPQNYVSKNEKSPVETADKVVIANESNNEDNAQSLEAMTDYLNDYKFDVKPVENDDESREENKSDDFINSSIFSASKKRNIDSKINDIEPQKPKNDLSDIDLLLQELESKK